MRKTKKTFRRLLGIITAIAVMLCVMTAAAQISAAAADGLTAAIDQVTGEALKPLTGDYYVSTSGSNTTIIALVILIIFLILMLAAVVVVVLIVMNKKKNSAEPGPGSVPSPAPTNAQSFNRVQPGAQPVPNSRPQGFAPVQPQAVQKPAPAANVSFPVEDGAGDTTVLGVGSQGFILLRKNGSERISINKAEFFIGKEQAKVDYCIKDNNSISRRHAKIKVRAGKCYISDLGSTNCTYINGTKLSPNQEVALIPGDEIKLSNEVFEFIG
ncbi:MAG: FHA domain-containing protein [Ruminococcus sp.]|nr:FHA domain-containing protein [Ruminococcus sp.]